MIRATTLLLGLGLLVANMCANAAVPASLNYQAYLTDRSGATINAEALITFSIYAVEFGGSPLWSETQLVDVESGLMTVSLGRPANPFPVGLFDTPLWLGIAIEQDNELTPRRPLTSVGFAFKADDTNTVQGKTAAELDQSAHVADLGNPHAVQPEQIGAVTEAALDAHVTDTTNPHQVTAAQTGALDLAVLSAHTATPSAHHDRYTDGEAVNAIVAAGGPGSGLDADTLDGVQASTLQSAIAANTDDIAQNTAAIQSGPPRLRVTSNGSTVGYVLDPTQLLSYVVDVLTESSFVFTMNLQTGQYGQVSDKYFTSADCSGPFYVREDTRGLAGRFLWQKVLVDKQDLPGASPQRYLIGPDTVFVDTTYNSLSFDGLCADITGEFPLSQPMPNDPAVTGLPNGPFPLPLAIEP